MEKTRRQFQYLISLCDALYVPSGDQRVFWCPFKDTNYVDEFQVIAISSMVAQLMKAKDQRILVHCAAGMNRSGLICALALSKVGMNIPDAIKLIREKRPQALQNAFFVDWLNNYQEKKDRK